MQIEPSALFSHYQVIRQIGVGGMGEVYLAEDQNLKRQVALKFLPFFMTLDEESKYRLKREAQTAASLNHPNIVTIYEIGEHEGRAFIAMEYVDGESLKELIKQGPMDLDRAFQIAIRLCDALAAAHQMGVVHRDIKPDNILFDRSERPKILDFGLAKFAQISLTQKDQVFGTPGYVAPEQIHCEEVDQRADIFSVGVVLYEMLSGKKPFVADTHMGVIYKILHDEPTPLAKLVPDVPAGVQELLNLALAKDPDARYQDMKAFRNDLMALRGDTATRSLPSGFALKIRRRRRDRFRLGVELVGLVLLIWAWFLVRQPPPEPPIHRLTGPGTAIAVFPLSVRASDEYAYLGEGMVDLLSTKLDEVADIRCVDARAILGHLARVDRKTLDRTDLRQVAKRFGAGFYVSGTVIEVAGQLNFDLALYDVGQNRPVAHSSLQSSPDELFELVDRAAVELLEGIAPEPAQRMRRLAAMTTPSFAALRAYLEGERAFREGRFADSIDHLQNAVRQDPEFALAYYRLSMAAEWLALTGLSQHAAEEAVLHSAKLTRHDKMLLDASLAWRIGDVNRAESLYREILEIYVDDLEAWFQLGEVRFHFGPVLGMPLSDARVPFEHILELDPDHGQAIWHLMRVDVFDRDIEAMQKRVKRLRQLQPAGERLIEVEALAAVEQDDRKAIENVIERLDESSDIALMLAVWNVGVYANDPFRVTEFADQLIANHRPRETRALGYFVHTYLSIAQGKYSDAMTYLDQATPLNPRATLELKAYIHAMPFMQFDRSLYHGILRELQDPPEAMEPDSPNLFLTVHNGFHDRITAYLQGHLSIRANEFDRVPGFAAQITTQGDKNQEMAARDMALGLTARARAEQGDWLGAAGLYDGLLLQSWYGNITTSPFYSRGLERYLYAVSLAKAGDVEAAQLRFRSFTHYSIHDLMFWAPSLYQMGVSLESSEPDQAAICLARFLDLWRHADARFQPLIRDAETRLAAIQQRL